MCSVVHSVIDELLGSVVDSVGNNYVADSVVGSVKRSFLSSVVGRSVAWILDQFSTLLYIGLVF